MNVIRMLVVMLAACAALAPAARCGAIHTAIAVDDLDRVARLLQEDPSRVNEPDEGGCSDLPMHAVAATGNVEIARMLLDAGAEIDGLDSDGSTPLGVAAVRRQAEMVRFLLEKGADVNRRDRNGAYSLSFAASAGDSAIVRMLLNAGADLHFLSPQGLTLLHFAGSRGLWSLTDLLIAQGADMNRGDDQGRTPLHLAANSADSTRVAGLIARGANVDVADSMGWTPLISAVASGASGTVRELLRRGADPKIVDRANRTALHLAAWNARPEIAVALLNAGADPNLADERGATPLCAATKNGRTSVVSALLDGGCRLGGQDEQHSWSPLHTACIRGQRDLVRALVEHGAALDARDDRGLTPLDLAARYGHKGVVKYLKGRGAKGTAPIEAGGCGLKGAKGLGPGEAVVWNLGHSGRAIKTRNHLFVFDYFPEEVPSDEPGLCSGSINPAELSGENVTVFVSHEHRDHFSQEIFGWRNRNPKIKYVFGFLPNSETPVEVIAPRETRTVDGMKVTAIRSNDSGVGFVVEVDGLVLFHAGDHANRIRDLSGNYTPEIEFLKSSGVRPDIAMLPVSGCGFGDQVAVRIGTEYTLDELLPALFIPMHNGSFGAQYAPFIADCQGRHPGVRMEALECRGDHVRYRKNAAS